MQYNYDMMIVSPHLDDAVLSCGGHIYLLTASGRRVLVVTLMAGDAQETGLSDYAQSLHQRWQLDLDAVARRREEDMNALRILGASTVHLPFTDCIYRRDHQTGIHFYRSDEAIFAEVNELERDLVQEISGCLRALPPARQRLVPFGIGNHVDHQIARAAAENVFAKELLYYEEYPYAAQPEAKNAMIEKEETGWEEIIISLPQEALQAKIEAIAAYQSQLSTFFADRQDLEQQVSEYHKLVGGERLWRRKSSIA